MKRFHQFAAIAASALLPVAASAQDHDHGQTHTMPDGMTMPAPDRPPSPAGKAPPMAMPRHPVMAMADMPAMDASTLPASYREAATAALAHAPAGSAMAGMTMGTSGGWYGQASGTARLPAGEGPMRGAMIHAGGWMLMAHGYAWGVATGQGGPNKDGRRGDRAAFVETMAMLMADRDLDDATHIQLRAMGSLEPAMGPRGYPNLFATGEIANGRPLVDRQHPHDLFMELSARIDRRMGDGHAFLYAAPVGEPALGPGAFMHRGSARYLPLSPITHHWFDSTHITYGVVTMGYAANHWQAEASAFNGREPDDRRWNLDPIKLDSWSVRATWTPSPYIAGQVSHGRLTAPEQSHPGTDEARTTASIGYARDGLAATFGYAVKTRLPGESLSAFLAEATWEMTRRHAVFGRVENVANDELFPDHADPLHDRIFRVTKAEGGYAYRLPIAGPFGVALGGTLAMYAKPTALDAAYGRAPVSWTLFAKLALGL